VAGAQGADGRGLVGGPGVVVHQGGADGERVGGLEEEGAGGAVDADGADGATVTGVPCGEGCAGGPAGGAPPLLGVLFVAGPVAVVAEQGVLSGADDRAVVVHEDGADALGAEVDAEPECVVPVGGVGRSFTS